LDLAEVWDGVCEIDINVAERALFALEQDPILARCFLEVLREAVTNAIKHGEAPRVWVEADLDMDRLRLSIINDGRDPVVLGPGYGTAIIEELTLASSLRVESGKTIFRAEIPISSSFSSLLLG
jgi:nitrate/nitrite-specific signal transduction histidine kinase